MGMSGAVAEVVHDPQRGQFHIDSNGLRSVLDYRLLDDAEVPCMVIHHTGVPEALRGRGLAERLARAALEHAMAAGWSVRPDCVYIARFLERHRDYRERLRLVAPG